jgi:multidrug efflux pump subunit AcrA (membrane-fusion protein)
MTLFRPAVIEAQRRRVYGEVTLHQPARLAAFALVAVVGVATATAFLAIGTFARKETVAGWVVPTGDLASVSAPRGGVVAVVSVVQGDYVRRGQTLIVLDMGAQGGGMWGNRVPVSSTLLVAPLDGQVASVNARAGVEAVPGVPLISIVPQGAAMEAQILVPTRAAGFVVEGQNVRLMIDAFPFQQFGAMQGEVREIAKSATRPGEMAAPIEFKESVYRVRVALTGPMMQAYGVNKPLQPGMTLKADVITDKRTFLSYLLNPLLAARARAEAG